MTNETLILNTSLFTVKFTDGMEAEYSDNIIAENVWAQCENVVNQVQLKEDNLKCRYERILYTVKFTDVMEAE